MKRGMIRIGLILSSWVAIVALVLANSAEFDPSFGEDGVAKTAVSIIPNDITMQADGKILVSGTAFNSTAPIRSAVLVRYQSNGELDATFGDNGIVLANVSDEDYGRKHTIQPDGKIIIVGNTTINGDHDGLIGRFNTDGTIDDTFGTDGFVVYPISAQNDVFSDVALQPDGKIIVADSKNHIVRFQDDGTIDATFGSSGLVTLAGNDAFSLIIQSDGKIVSAGYEGISRLETNGAIDGSFDDQNNYPIGFQAPAPVSIAQLEDGHLIVTATVENQGTSNNFNNNMVVAKFTSDGTRDIDFGTLGVATFDYVEGHDVVNDVVVQQDGKLLVVGVVDNDNLDNLFALLRFNPDDTVDTAFGENGMALLDLNTVGMGLTIQPDNKVVATGFDDALFELMTVRFMGEYVAPPVESEHFVYVPLVEEE